LHAASLEMESDLFALSPDEKGLCLS
jgi:hypothetical protein